MPKFRQLRLISSCNKIYFLFLLFIMLTSTAQKEDCWETKLSVRTGLQIMQGKVSNIDIISMSQLLETLQDFHLVIGNICFEINSIKKSIANKAKSEN